MTTVHVTPAPAQGEGGQCAAITQPLTPEEMAYAQSAWTYFVDNVQPSSGLSNSAGGFPSGTLWDLGNYLTAMNAARWMGIIDQAEFDGRLNQFLTSLGQLRLFEDTLPNKVYNSATGEIVDYGNNPLEKGIGWSALDIGRILAAFHILRTCHPQYADWMAGIIDSWSIDASLQDGMLYGAAVLPDGSTLKVQEGRLGYEEYAARGYALWGFDAPQALSYDPFQFVDIYGLQIPVDSRDYQTTNANNYVVSESYILDAIEFGLQGDQADYARRVFEAQKRRYEDTGLLTAVSEDNINKAPYFLYSTVYSNGVPWAVITENNELHPELRTLCTKAAFGWHYVYPDDPYAQQIFDYVKDTTNSDRGYYAGIYESGLYDPELPINDILTGNTNGLIMEILYYKARGYQPMLGSGSAPVSTTSVPSIPQTEIAGQLPPPPNVSNTPQAVPPESTVSEAASNPLPQSTASRVPTSQPSQPQAIAVAPIGAVGRPKSSECPLPTRELSITDARYAKTAWQYFEANYQPSGLVPDRSDLDGATLWGMGDYLSALHTARVMNVINADKFDERVRHLLGALQEIQLFAGELPHRAYSTLTLEPIDYGGNTTPDGNGWSGLDVGRLLAALHTLKACHSEYTDAVDQVALDWSYLRVVRNGRIANARLAQNDRGRDRIRVNPAEILGYEEYAARAFQLWGFDAARSAVSGNYLTANVENQAVPVHRSQAEQRQHKELLNTTSTPFILYGLEFGFDPQISSLVQAIYQAEANRYDRTGTFSASGTTLINQAPYVVHSTLVSDGRPWAAVDDDGTVIENSRVVSTAVAFAYYTLFPNSDYGRELWLATLDLYNPLLGYYEGFYEEGGHRAIGFTGGTNSLILQALLHKNTQQQPLIQPYGDMNSPWWRAIREGDPFGLGLPEVDQPLIEMIASDQGNYWLARDKHTVANSPLPSTSHIASSVSAPVVLNDSVSVSVPSPRGQPPVNVGTAQNPIVAPSPSVSSEPVIRLVANTLSFPLDSPDQLNPQDQTAAQRAWAYFENNWNANTVMVNAVDGLAWTTWGDRVDAIVARYNLNKLVKDGWLWDSSAGRNGLQYWQEGHLGYEQYAAYGLKLWGVEAENALHNPPTHTVSVDGVELTVDRRDRASSGASNYLTNDPYLLWGLEIGWPDATLP